jgi:hypothetical protein
LDPQLYVPDCDHTRLTAHGFWPQVAEYWRDPRELSRVITELVRMNDELGTTQIISPAPIASVISDDSLQPVVAALEELGRQGVGPDRILATVALTSDAVRNEDRAEMLSDAIESWDVAGIYLVAEHPSGEYLVTDPMWLARILDIVAGARLVGKTVLIGYSSHQMLLAATAGATAIASGTWMNVRAFSARRFEQADDDDVSRRATWYYAPHLLSEFKIAYLDIARRLGRLPSLQTPAGIDGSFASVLFSGTQPTTADFGESASFRHYLHCLRQQVNAAKMATFQDTTQGHEALLSVAEAGLADLRRANIVSPERGFQDALPANRAALGLLIATRGPILTMEWPGL